MRAYLLSVTLIALASCQAQPLDPTMDISFYRTDVEKPIALDVAPTVIRDADAEWVLPPPAAADGDGMYTRPFANGQRNSRLPAALPDGIWEVAATLPLDNAYAAEFVLHVERRLLVQQSEAWQLVDRDGTPLARGGREDGEVVVDPEHERFYTNDHTGFIKAWDLATGEPQFLLFPMFGQGYNRSVLRANGERLWLVGTELPVMSHRATRSPEYTILELHTLGNPLRTDEEQMLLSNRRLETLMTRPVPMLTAVGASGLVLTAPNHLFLVDEALQVTADLQSVFTPLAISLDEAGLMYLIVRVPDEAEEGVETRALWGLTPDGQRFLNVPIPAMPGDAYRPPMVGYDRTVYVVLEHEVVAVEPDGTQRWQQNAGAPIAGAVVTANHQVLVTAGPRILALDPATGERRLVFEGPGDTLRTPPVLVSPKRLVVASDSQLFDLTPMEYE